MRLHRLAVSAFGPFPGRVDVDFDALCASGIFLIHGPTGAGKSTLLDAICFALYAGVPGARPAGRSLRSDHADPSAVPRVELELTVGGRRLRLTRSPEFARAKRRGTGTTTVPAAVTLSERTGAGWKPVSTRADEVGALLRDLLGLGLDQFATVVLLPQGNFAAFLRASPESRRELLEHLFDVARFTAVETWLADQRRLAGAALAEAEEALRTLSARTSDVVARLPGGPLPGPAWDQVPIPDVPGVLADLARQVGTLATTSLVDRDTAEARERSLQVGHDAAARRQQCRDRGTTGQNVLAGLADRAEQLQATADALAAGRRAAAVAGDLRAGADAAARSAAAGARVAQAAAGVTAVGLAGDTDPAAALAAAVELDTALAEAGHLDRSLASARDRLAEQDRAVQAARDEHAAACTAAEQAAAAAALLGEQHQSAATGAPDLTGRRRAVEGLTARLRWRRDLDDQTERLRGARARERTAAAGFQDARARWLDLRQAHLDALAARLAAGLTPGTPCPVCGSSRHPRPADSAAAVPDAALARAEAEVTAAQEQLTAAGAHVAHAKGQAAALRGQLGADVRDAATLDALLRAATEALQAAEASHRRVADLHEQLQAALTQLTDARERRERTGRAEQAAAGQRAATHEHAAREQAALADRLRRHGERCPCATFEITSVPAVTARHRAATAALETLDRARQALAEAAEQEGRTTAHVARRLAEHGFTSPAAAQAAAAPGDTLTGYEQVLAGAHRERVAAETVLADPDVQAALAADPPGLAELAAALARARADRQGADRRHAVTEVCARDLAALAGEATDAAATVTTRGQQAARTARLADTVNGLGSDNTLRMRLSSFVLAARLERVVELANERLARLGDGRYRLRHSDARARGTGRSGLGLAVEDLWTGQARDTATLSGGETFLASLALALGLADAVREDAGGFDLQTLFVDEGFGALDEDSLEQVLAVLDQLRDGGRAVGVVSHVADLRARIPDQLRVDKGADGSTVCVVRAGARVA